MILKKLPLILAGSTAILFSSCIQDEPLNAECDIIGLDTTWVNSNFAIFHSLENGNRIEPQENSKLSVLVKTGIDRTQLNPKFILTPGASITMLKDGKQIDANGVTRNFSSPQIYTVHSEDGQWSKEYTVSFNYPKPIKKCNFEYFELDPTGKFYVWYEMDGEDRDNPRRDYWASGNPGYAVSNMVHSPSDYPTTIDQGIHGNDFCIKLKTCDTGDFGMSLFPEKMPIAAGNIFLGSFRINLAKPRTGTKFGLQLVAGKPTYLTGYYKYTPGKDFTNEKKQIVPGRRDVCDIYAVLYEVNPKDFVPLNGDNILNSDRVVSIARIDDPGEPQEWKHFKEAFVPQNGKTFDEERLHNAGYAIAIVATSSRDGGYFRGAIGSTLWIDEMEIHYEGDIEEEN